MHTLLKFQSYSSEKVCLSFKLKEKYSNTNFSECSCLNCRKISINKLDILSLSLKTSKF